MMHICNYHVSKENSGALFFDEDFCMAEFSMHFDVEPDSWDSALGHLDINPVKRTATLFFYGSPEDHNANIETFDLYDFDGPGADLIEAFRRYNLSALYHAAERFTLKTVTNYLEKMERA